MNSKDLFPPKSLGYLIMFFCLGFIVAGYGQKAEVRLSLSNGATSTQSEIALRPDGRTFLATSDRTVDLWDIATGKAIHSFEGHKNTISRMTLLPDGKTFISQAQQEMFLWDINTGNLIRSVEVKNGDIFNLSILPDGKSLLAFGSRRNNPNSNEASGVIEKWDVQTGKVIQSFEGHRGHVGEIVFIPGGTRFISRGNDNAIKLWDYASGKMVYSVDAHPAGIKNMYLSADGRTLISYGQDKVIASWDVASGRGSRTITVQENILKLLVLPDGSGILGSTKGAIKFWGMDLEERPIQKFVVPKEWRKIKSNFLNPTPNPDGSLDYWSFETGLVRPLYVLPGENGFIAGSQRWDNSGVVLRMDFPRNESLNNQPKVVLIPGKNSFLWTPDSRVELRNCATGTLIKKFQGETEITRTIAKIPNSDDFVTDGDYYLNFWNLALSKVDRTFLGYGRERLKFLPDGKSFLTSNGRAVFHWDVSSGKLLSFVRGNLGKIYEIKLLPDGQSFLSICESGIEHLSIAPAKTLHSYEGNANEQTSILLFPNSKYFFSVSNDKTTKLWDINSGKLLFSSTSKENETPSTRFLTMRLSIHNNSNSFFQADGDKTIKQFDLTGKVLQTYVVPGSQQRDFHSVVAMLPGGDGFLSGYGGSVHHWSISTGKLLHSFEGSHVSAVHPDGKSFFGVASSGTIKHFDLATGKLLHDFTGHANPVGKILILPDGKKFLSEARGNNGEESVKFWDITTGKLLQSFEVKNSLYGKDIMLVPDNKGFLSIADDRTIKYWDLTSGKLVASFLCPGDINDVKFVDQGKSILACTSSGTIHYINLQKGEVVQYIGRMNLDYNQQPAAFAEDLYLPKDYITITPDGYYMGTKRGVPDLVHFVLGRTSYTFDQFDLQYNRPDIVLERIGKAPAKLIDSYKRAYEKRLNKLGFNPQNFEKERSFNVPEIEITNSEYLVATAKPEYQLSFKAKDKLFKLDRINLFINGVPVYGTKGLDVKNENVQDLARVLDVSLSNGKNLIEISALNEKGVESLKGTLEIEYTPTKTTRPNLYIVNIGVSQYKNPKMNLAYADKDASDVSELFKNKIDLFENVIPITVLNEDVTIENIAKIKKTLLKTSVDDRVILSFSGHGLLDAKLDYYLATHDVNFSNPSENGLPYEALEGLLDGIPARQKILFMDACNSGEIDKEEVVASNDSKQGAVKFTKAGDQTIEKRTMGLKNSFELMQELFTDLRRSTGTTSISSSSGTQVSWEDANYKNGVFTYCLLTGLKERKADANKDGKIMLSELKMYVQTQVSNLTQGKQQPTSRIENLESDWQIW